MLKVLVFGWYPDKCNVGDALFMDAFKFLFPSYEFTFADHITDEQLIGVDAIFFGGGSFLSELPPITSSALEYILNKPIFYIGVGVEGNINSTHKLLMQAAKLIAIRSAHSLNQVLAINTNSIVIPDLVFAIPSEAKNNGNSNSILILPSSIVLPRWSDPHWQHVAWEYFKSEFAQVLDTLIEANREIKFFPMCRSQKIDDTWAAYEVIAKMKRRSNGLLINDIPTRIDAITDLFSQYGSIITQRFHGIILAEKVRTPYLSISHHDKLNHIINGESMSYYGFSKQKMFSFLNQNLSLKNEIIKIDQFDQLVGLVNDTLRRN